MSSISLFNSFIVKTIAGCHFFIWEYISLVGKSRVEKFVHLTDRNKNKREREGREEGETALIWTSKPNPLKIRGAETKESC